MHLKGKGFATEASLSRVLASVWAEGRNEKLEKDVEK